MAEMFTLPIVFLFIVSSDFISHRFVLCFKNHLINGPFCNTNKNVTWNVSITLLVCLVPSFHFPPFFPSLLPSFRPSIPPLPLSVFPKYVSLYHMRHRRIGLSEAGNDFFVLISALRGIRVVLVIRPFITLPTRHSAVGLNAISPDSHNYPKIERGREISPATALWVRESLGETHRKGERPIQWFFLTSRAVCMCATGCLFGWCESVWCPCPHLLSQTVNLLKQIHCEHCTTVTNS